MTDYEEYANGIRYLQVSSCTRLSLLWKDLEVCPVDVGEQVQFGGTSGFQRQPFASLGTESRFEAV
jgi:hypothetical protein